MRKDKIYSSSRQQSITKCSYNSIRTVFYMIGSRPSGQKRLLTRFLNVL